MNMKSSSNLIETVNGGNFSQTWMPADFSVQTVEAVEVKPREIFPDFTPSGADSSTEEISSIGESAFEPTPKTFLDNKPVIRKWSPDTVQPVKPEGSPQPAIKAVEPLDLESIREKLIQQTTDQASQILLKAQDQAAEMVRQAQESAQQVLLEAQHTGWKSAEAETRPMIQAVQNIIDEVQNWRDEMYAQSEAAILGLVKEIAHTLFCEGMALDEVALQHTFNKVLTNARSLGDLRIFVNPDDALNLGPYWREYQVSVSGQQIEIIPSDSIQRGGCFVEGEKGTVDGRVETQLKAIIDTIQSTAENAAPPPGK